MPKKAVSGSNIIIQGMSLLIAKWNLQTIKTIKFNLRVRAVRKEL